MARPADGYISGPLGPHTGAMIGGYLTRGDGIRSPGFDADRGGQITANLRQDLGTGSLLVFGRYLNDRSQWLLPIPLQQNGQSISAYPGFTQGTARWPGPTHGAARWAMARAMIWPTGAARGSCNWAAIWNCARSMA
jgi:hypothetical protein